MADGVLAAVARIITHPLDGLNIYTLPVMVYALWLVNSQQKRDATSINVRPNY